jgi:hypothetical protein
MRRTKSSTLFSVTTLSCKSLYRHTRSRYSNTKCSQLCSRNGALWRNRFKSIYNFNFDFCDTKPSTLINMTKPVNFHGKHICKSATRSSWNYTYEWCCEVRIQILYLTNRPSPEDNNPGLRISLDSRLGTPLFGKAIQYLYIRIALPRIYQGKEIIASRNRPGLAYILIKGQIVLLSNLNVHSLLIICT